MIDIEFEELEACRKGAYYANLDDLYRLYAQVDKEVETAKGRRIALVYFGFLLFFLYVAFSIFEITDISIKAILMILLVCVVLSALVYFFLLCLFSWLFSKNRADSARRNKIALRIKYAEVWQRNFKD